MLIFYFKMEKKLYAWFEHSATDAVQSHQNKNNSFYGLECNKLYKNSVSNFDAMGFIYFGVI